MTIWFLLVFLALQLTLLMLDMWETRRQGKKESEPIRRGTIGFLVLVFLVYFCLQLGGSRLLPTPDELLDSVWQASLQWSGQEPATSLAIFPKIVLGVVLFYVAGFWDYLVHRCFSHSRLFWVTHEYHHLPRQVTVWMPGISARPFGFIPVAISTLATVMTIYAMLTALRLPLWSLQPVLHVALLIGLVLTASHSAFLRRFVCVHRAMQFLYLTTPHEHLLHHRVDSCCNYGNFTTLWDRLLGTYENPELIDLETLPLGLSYNQDFLGAITFGRWRLTPAQRERYQISRYCNIDDGPNTP